MKLSYYFDELSNIKLQYFTDNEADGLKPKCGTVNVADGTVNGITATICYGPGPGL